MKKKVISAFLCVAMAATMFTGCGNKAAEEKTDAPASEAVAPEEEPATEASAAPVAEMAAAEDLPESAFAHLTFDGDADEGYKAMVQTDDVGDNDGATYGLAESADASFSYVAGAVGNCLALDGSYGLDLGLEPTNTDTYTVSFWINADRLASYGPTLQMGYNMGKAADAGNDVTWLNVTQSEWGTDSAKVFPIVWSRNEASDAEDGTDCWPWMYSFDDQIHGKQEWAMVTIVCSGEEQKGATGAATVGAQYYVNGVMVYDSQDNYTNNSYFEYTWDASLAPNIMKPGDSTFESLFGINYWDTIFKGYIDDLYVYDSALTAGQVATLYQMGDATVTPSADAEAVADTEATATAQTVTTVDDAAIATVGATTCDNAFWTSNTDGYELADGATVTLTFNNYSSGINNWDNYVLAFCNTPVTADKLASADNYEGYAEYGVLRADAFAWGFATDDGNVADPAYTWDWDNFASIMMNAKVVAKISRAGSDVTINAVVTAADGTEYTYDVTAPTAAAAADPMYVFITGEASYIELLSAE